MKILEPPTKSKVFTCEECGCVFEAKASEYYKYYGQDDFLYEACCPYCDNTVYLREIIEN